MNKIFRGILSLSTVMILILAGCGRISTTQYNESEDITEYGEVQQPQVDRNTEESSTEEASVVDERNIENTRMLFEFAEALYRVNYGGTMPDGGILASMDTESNMFFSNPEEDKFAICDIDGDGKEELLISISSTYTSGMIEQIYEYDLTSNILNCQYTTYPLTTYYDNGIVKTGLSHNQGLAGPDYWPYILVKYNSATSTYEWIADVDNWDGNCFEQDYDGTPFPKEIDLDGDGVLYRLRNTENESEFKNIDGTEFHTWLNRVMGDAKELSVPWKPLEETYYIDYVRDYVMQLCNQQIASGNSAENDIGLWYMMNMNNSSSDNFDRNMEELLSHLNQSYGIEFSKDGEGDRPFGYNGNLNGEMVFYINMADVGGVHYSGSQVEDLTICGVYPGMSEEEAIKKLEDYGFKRLDEISFVTGESTSNFEAFLNVENGVVTGIGFSPYVRLGL